MDYLVDRMRHASCDEIRLVTRADKEDVVTRGRQLGLRVIEATPATAAESLGAGLGALDGEDVVLVGFPDTIWEPVDGFVRLMNALGDDVAAALGLFRTPELERSDVVSVDEGWRVTAVDVKPAQPRSEWIWGCAAAYARSIADVADSEDIGHHFSARARGGLVRGVPLSDAWLDVGTREGLERALTNNGVPADRDSRALR